MVAIPISQLISHRPKLHEIDKRRNKKQQLKTDWIQGLLAALHLLSQYSKLNRLGSHKQLLQLIFLIDISALCQTFFAYVSFLYFLLPARNKLRIDIFSAIYSLKSMLHFISQVYSLFSSIYSIFGSDQFLYLNDPLESTCINMVCFWSF